jgi:VHL beta domain
VSPKQSFNNRCGIPGTVSALFITVAFALTLSPYLANADFGVLKVPDFQPTTLHMLEILGPMLLLISILLNYPFFAQVSSSPRSAGTSIAITVVFQNPSKRYVNIDWLDFDGKLKPELRCTLIPGENRAIETFVGHVWQASDANSGVVIRDITIRDGVTSVNAG